jgi:hypothetical protein
MRMFGLSKNVTLALVGWLWADILLGLFVIFLAAASAPTTQAHTGPNIDPTPIELSIPVDGAALLSSADDDVAEEQERFAEAVKAELASRSESRRVALVFAYGTHGDPAEGEKLAKAATDALRAEDRFAEAVMKDLHDIVPGDRGSTVALEIYLYR